MHQEMKRQGGQEYHRDPEVDLTPGVAIEPPQGRAVTAPGWENVEQQDARRREEYERGECHAVDAEVEGRPLHERAAPARRKDWRFSRAETPDSRRRA